MTSTLHALRSGWRHVVKSPGSSFLAVLALALGLGLTTAAFSLLDAVFLRGLPLEDAERLVRLERLERGSAERSPATLHDFLDWRRRAPALEELAAFRGVSLNLSGEGCSPSGSTALSYRTTCSAPSVVPALRAARSDPASTLRQG